MTILKLLLYEKTDSYLPDFDIFNFGNFGKTRIC